MYIYDVALSFASNEEKLVEEVATYLRADGLKVFFFPEEQRDLVSQDPRESIYRVFQRESFIKVLFVNETYEKSQWTQLERRCSVRGVGEERERLIIVNFLGKKLDEKLNKYIYIDGEKVMPDEVASFIVDRINDLQKPKKEEKESAKNIVYENKGIITGDNAVFHNIHF